jgi:hypothetical protein
MVGIPGSYPRRHHRVISDGRLVWCVARIPTLAVGHNQRSLAVMNGSGVEGLGNERDPLGGALETKGETRFRVSCLEMRHICCDEGQEADGM